MTAAQRESEEVPSGRPARRMLVAMVGLDAATEAIVEAACARSEAVRPKRKHDESSSEVIAGAMNFELRSFPDMQSVRATLEANAWSAAILVTDGEVLRKRRSFPADVFVLALVGPSAPTAIEADDYLRRPFDTAELAARVGAAARSLAAEHRATVRGVLRDTIDQQRSGEVVISLGAESARIHVDRGRVAWIHRAPQPAPIRALLGAWGIELDEASWRDVIEESRASRKHFGDVLVDWGMVERQRLRAALRQHLITELGALLASPIATANFVAETRVLGSSLTFDEQELPPLCEVRRIETRTDIPATAPIPPPPSSRTSIADWFASVARIPDAVGCALMSARTGEVMHRRGELEEAAIWSLVGGFAALEDEGAELVATSSRATYLIRSGRPLTDAVLVVRFDPGAVSAAMARLRVAQILDARS